MERANILSTPVNRSLTMAEYEFQRYFNRHYGKASSRFVSDVVVNRLPAIKSEKPLLHEETIALVIQRNEEAAQKLNRYLPDGEHLNLEFPDDLVTIEQKSDFVFSAEQLNFLAEGIAQKLHQLEERNTRLSDKNRDLLEIIARSGSR